MKKRLVKKALMSGRYFEIWCKPGVDEKISVPRNGRCGCIFQRACYHIGHPEFIEIVEDNIRCFINKIANYTNKQGL